MLGTTLRRVGRELKLDIAAAHDRDPAARGVSSLQILAAPDVEAQQLKLTFELVEMVTLLNDLGLACLSAGDPISGSPDGRFGDGTGLADLAR